MQTIKCVCIVFVMYVASVCTSDKKPPILSAEQLQALQDEVTLLYGKYNRMRTGAEKQAAFEAYNKASFALEQHRQNLERKKAGKSQLPWMEY